MPIKVEWTHNNKLLNPSTSDFETGIHMSNLGQRIHGLAIEAVTAKHRGNFSCICSNRAGFSKYTAELVVNG